MEEAGLWRLFFVTGLPEAYLALRGQEEEQAFRKQQMAMTAFFGKKEPKQEV